MLADSFATGGGYRFTDNRLDDAVAAFAELAGPGAAGGAGPAKRWPPALLPAKPVTRLPELLALLHLVLDGLMQRRGW